MTTIVPTVRREGIFEISLIGASATGLVAGDQSDTIYSAFYESVTFQVRGNVGSTPSIRFLGSPDGVNFSNMAGAATTTGIFTVGANGYPHRYPFIGVSATGSASMDIAVSVVGLLRNSLLLGV